MPDGRLAALLLPQQAPPPPNDTLGQRLGMLALCLAFGAWMIFVGRANVRAREAEEGGKRGVFYRLLGKPKIYRGRSAVAMGWLRIVVGAAVIVFGFVFLIFGAFLRK